MLRTLFTYFLTTHVLGDFYLQSNKLAANKQSDLKYVILHGRIYLLASMLCAVPFWSGPLFIAQAALALSHLLVDSAKFAYIQGKKQNAAVFVIDQLIHMACMAIAALILCYQGHALAPLPIITTFLLKTTGGAASVFAWAGALLVILKPANIALKRVLDQYRPLDIDPESGKSNAGAFIGSLERILILALLSVSQYSAIGLVLTAKSVARYDKISKNQQFAEYYLLGTLMSALYAIVVYFLYF